MKKVLFFTLLCFFTSLILPQTQSGTYFFDKSTSGFTLDKNEGKRYMEKEITFNKPFESKPDVYITVTVLDAAKKTRMRYSAEPKAVSRDGFLIKISVWGDTQINGIGGNWVAHAEKLELKKEKIEVGQTIKLNNIYFEFNKAVLLPESYPELNTVANFLKENSTVEIELAGHTDNIGSNEYNMSLSQKRADAVKNYIIGQGIDSRRLVSKGYGESKPVATNETDYGREQNRRVEFTVLKK